MVYFYLFDHFDTIITIMNNAIELKNIHFSYDNENSLFENLSLSFSKGQMHGLLGPNGAGKSTLIKLISGLLLPHLGEVKVCNQSSEEDIGIFGKTIGLLSDHAPLYLNMTVFEYLYYCGVLKKISKKELKARVQYLLEKLEIESVSKKIIKTLSTGFRQRVALAQALIHDPEILILDEPTSGLDPQSSSNFRDILNELKKNHTIIFSSHQLHEVETLCDNVTMVFRGKILFHGDLNIALQNKNTNQISIKIKSTVKLEKSYWENLLGLKFLAWENEQSQYQMDFCVNLETDLNIILTTIINQKVTILEVLPKKRHLEDQFLDLVKTAGQET